MKPAKKVLSAKYHKKYYTLDFSYIFTYYVHYKIQSLAIINAVVYQYFLYYVAIVLHRTTMWKVLKHFIYTALKQTSLLN